MGKGPPITELAAGTVDGVNKQFATVSHDYATGTLRVFRNGSVSFVVTELGGKDFEVATAPLAGDQISVYYRPI